MQENFQAAGAPPQTPVGELTAISRSLLVGTGLKPRTPLPLSVFQASRFGPLGLLCFSTSNSSVRNPGTTLARSDSRLIPRCFCMFMNSTRDQTLLSRLIVDVFWVMYFTGSEIWPQNAWVWILRITGTSGPVAAGGTSTPCERFSRRRTRFHLFDDATESQRRYGSEHTATVPDNHIRFHLRTWTEHIRYILYYFCYKYTVSQKKGTLFQSRQTFTWWHHAN